MGNIIPYFYYDIVARMIPGAATLYVLALLGFQPSSSVSSFFAGSDTWKGVAATLVLGGAAYALGVFFEALFFFPLLNGYKEWTAKKAFEQAARKYVWHDESLRKQSEDCSFKTRAWEELVLRGSKSAYMKSVFAHCHRFQAESKMCQHLLVPTVLYALMVHVPIWPIRIAWSGAAFIFLLLASYWRDERRWWQVLSFGERLGFLPGMSAVPRKFVAEDKLRDELL